MSNEKQIKIITEKFGGECNTRIKVIHFANPIKINSRADALDMLFLLQLVDDDWSPSLEEPLKALKNFIKVFGGNHA